MKRISFKDSGGLNLTQAVLSGRKTMTRRAVIEQVERDAMVYAEGKSEFTRVKFEYVLKHSPYKVGEIVAIQQAYKDIPPLNLYSSSYGKYEFERSAGWTNKMFVAARFMPHHIRITDVRVERLQLIPYKDCLREGIIRDVKLRLPRYYAREVEIASTSGYTTARIAFAALIDKVSGRGTWDSNPLVWVYSFELVD